MSRMRIISTLVAILLILSSCAFDGGKIPTRKANILVPAANY